MNTKLANTNGVPPTLSRRSRKPVKKKRKRSWGRVFGVLFLTLFCVGLIFTGWFFLTPPGSQFRYMMADTLITTQHRHWAKYLIGTKGLEKEVERYNKQFEQMANV